jgi:hypothetical protein
MRNALLTVALTLGLAVALTIDVCVLIGTLPISAAACVSVVAAIIVTSTKPTHPKAPPFRGLTFINAAPASRAAENGEDYVITGKSIHDNPGKFE